ncbi:MAG TPA: DUF2269 domain-containing protein [Phenylobacterium sp.]|jgi:uncharacterized membrane protein|uniref:DUF2269 family protein n=1 Tax=Phenylobacterium sp. TaxID=1871053 RepID=UPI002BE18278|nr:DUF2269 domain-containing protein [Phenylobacterium sp.]HQN50303.1 DUF2269 domain-containing protein [Phenylobacterium sp.]HQP20010.1 DUF2269 domain-containing protein [Phenylobacterium sp.]
MSLYLLVKLAHIIGAAVLFGTGAGIAFFMLMAHRTRDPALIAHTAGVVVLADTLFTATAVALQPITGLTLAHLAGWDLGSLWILASAGLYVVTGLCWLPVVWIQIRLRDLARAAHAAGEPLPPAYDRLWRAWFVLGFPAFAAVLAILWLMLAKPGG